MAQSNLATEIRNQTRRFIEGGSSLREFRVWFIDADDRAHRGEASGREGSQVAAMTDEIQEALSDLDGGFIDVVTLTTALHAIVTLPRGEPRFESRDTALRHLYHRPMTILAMAPEFVPA